MKNDAPEPKQRHKKFPIPEDLLYFALIFIASCLMSKPLFSYTRIINQGDTFPAFIKVTSMHQSWVYGQWAGR